MANAIKLSGRMVADEIRSTKLGQFACGSVQIYLRNDDGGGHNDSSDELIRENAITGEGKTK